MTCITVKYIVNVKQSFGFGFGLFSFLRFLNLIIINNNIFINFGEYIYIYITAQSYGYAPSINVYRGHWASKQNKFNRLINH